MPAIRILPDLVANQIAAGEVVERPVAVVKELVENSLDAGATRIEVEFRNGGKSYIRVEDNGAGMSPDDALLSLERHGTSKIRQSRDLDSITTFGFRGEALPSIASVSHFTLRTRNETSLGGTEVLVNGGKLAHRRDCGMPPGTCVEVAHLFNSVPARRKFLKTENTEAAHIVHLTRLYAVANPEVSFALIENGRPLFQSPVCTNLRERVREIFGRQIAEPLITLEAQEPGLRLRGLIGKPGVGRSTRQEMVTFVNQRPVFGRTLHYAILESYHTYLPKGRYPLAFLFLDLDARGVDVNVHPTKREVRFRDEARVRQFVMRAVLDCLREAAGGLKPQLAAADSNLPAPAVPNAIKPAPRNAISPVKAQVESQPTRGTSTPPAITKAPVASPAPVPAAAAQRPLDWRFVGLIHDAYALFETPAGLVLLNRRAAQERILYEDILGRLGEAQPTTQQLLFPIPLELDPVSSATLTEHLGFLRNNGFVIEPFGRNFFRLEALPDWLDPARGEQFARDLVARIRERGLRPDQPDLAHEEIARMASIRGNPTTGETALVNLARRLLACRNPLTDPRGRPTYYEISRADLEKRFG